MLVSGDCKLVENKGFLKEKCQELPGIFEVYKCASSGEYYSSVTHTELFSRILVTGECSGDPRSYQSCGLNLRREIINSVALCDAVICQHIYKALPSWKSTISVNLERLCHFHPRNKYKSCKAQPSNKTCQTFSNELHIKLKNTIKECDMICQEMPFCEDEAVCNGLQYGLYCLKDKKRRYISTYRICDMVTDCDDQSDERHCLLNAILRGPGCIKSESANQRIPLNNYTRCGPLKYGKSGKKCAFCRDFTDQLNCSDPIRGVLECEHRRYPVTVSRAVLCLEGVHLCDDELEKQCKQTSPQCVVHKHLLCNGENDCSDGSDERDIQCNTVIQEKCYRR